MSERRFLYEEHPRDNKKSCINAHVLVLCESDEKRHTYVMHI